MDVSTSEKLWIWSKALLVEVLAIAFKVGVFGFCIFMLLYWVKALVLAGLGISQ